MELSGQINAPALLSQTENSSFLRIGDWMSPRAMLEILEK